MTFNNMYETKVISIANDQLSPRMITRAIDIAAVAAKHILSLWIAVSDLLFFLNFIENIGSSLTSSRESNTEHTGMKNFVAAHPAMTPDASTLTKYANEPQIIAHAGVGRPMKFSVCLSSTLNFASLTPESTAMMSGI